MSNFLPINHILSLTKIFQLPFTVELLRRLVQIEKEGNKAALDYCNGTISNDTYAKIESDLRAALPAKIANHKALLFNSDCRGYFLKLDDTFMRSDTDVMLVKDWGGYGIIAPEELEVFLKEERGLSVVVQLQSLFSEFDEGTELLLSIFMGHRIEGLSPQLNQSIMSYLKKRGAL